MDIAFIFASETFSLFVLPVLIFIARVMDVTLGTLRIISVSRGRKSLAPIFGFFEIIIWLFAIGQIMQNLTNIVYYIAYAAGFAMGNFVGIYIEERMAIGTFVIRVITRMDADKLVEYLKSAGYGVTSFDGYGARGRVKLIYTAVKRKDIDEVVNIVKQFNPKAFFSIEEVKSVSAGIFPVKKPWYKKVFHGTFRLLRPGK